MTIDEMKRLIDSRDYDGAALVAIALVDVAAAIRFSGKEIGKEGAPGMGAIEFLAAEVRKGLESIGARLDESKDQTAAGVEE